MIFAQSPWIWFIPVFIVLILIVTIVAICICKWPRRNKVPRHVDPRIILKDVQHVEVITNPGIPESPSPSPRFSSTGEGLLVRKIDLSIPPEVPSVDPPPLPSRQASMQKKASSKKRKSKSRKNQLRLVDEEYHGLEAQNFSTMIPDIGVMEVDINDHKRFNFNLDPAEYERDKLILE